MFAMPVFFIVPFLLGDASLLQSPIIVNTSLYYSFRVQIIVWFLSSNLTQTNTPSLSLFFFGGGAGIHAFNYPLRTVL